MCSSLNEQKNVTKQMYIQLYIHTYSMDMHMYMYIHVHRVHIYKYTVYTVYLDICIRLNAMKGTVGAEASVWQNYTKNGVYRGV